MDISNETLGYLFRGYKMDFQRGLQSSQLAEEFLRFTMRTQSSTDRTTYPWLGQFPKLREWVGDRIVKKLDAHDYTIKNKKFESTVEVDRTAIEDDQFGIYSPMMEEMGIAAAEYPGDAVYDLIRQGDSLLCYDGQPFFSASHPVGDGTESNWGGGSGELWVLIDDSRRIKPFVWQDRIRPEFQRIAQPDDERVVMQDVYTYGVRARGAAGFGLWQLAYGSKQTLDATNFNAAMAQVMSLKNDEGSDLKIRPTLLVTTPANRAAALGLLKAERLTDGSSNTNFGAVELLITNQLAA